jgi:hypothetical protein
MEFRILVRRSRNLEKSLKLTHGARLLWVLAVRFGSIYEWEEKMVRIRSPVCMSRYCSSYLGQGEFLTRLNVATPLRTFALSLKFDIWYKFSCLSRTFQIIEVRFYKLFLGRNSCTCSRSKLQI